jgi:hypothetical protein
MNRPCANVGQRISLPGRWRRQVTIPWRAAGAAVWLLGWTCIQLSAQALPPRQAGASPGASPGPPSETVPRRASTPPADLSSPSQVSPQAERVQRSPAREIQALADGDVDIGLINNELDRLGSWVLRRGGTERVWFPHGSRVGWRPYTYGHWVISNLGSTWLSDEPFGWITYHFGRWDNDPGNGWVWVPGYVWGPAWVAWRVGGGYVGWAPLPSTVGFRFGVGPDFSGVDLDVPLKPSDFCFVEVLSLLERNLATMVVPPARNLMIIRNTHDITYYAAVSGPIVRGLSVEVEQVTGRKVQTYQVTADITGMPHDPQERGNQLVVFVPLKTRSTSTPRTDATPAALSPPRSACAPQESPPRIKAEDRYAVRARKTISLDSPDVPLPGKPLDSHLRVVLYLPSDLTSTNATFAEAGDVGVESGHIVARSADMITVDFSAAFSTLAEKVVRRLFPQLRATRTLPAAGSYDLLLSMTISSHVVVNPDDTFRGFEVCGAIDIADSTGTRIDSVEGVGHAYATKTHYWSGTSRSKAIGTPALTSAQSLLFTRLTASAPLRSYLESRTAERERPPGLVTTVAFDDRDGLIPNGRLDAGEKAHLMFTVRNDGPGPAYDVRLAVESRHQGVSVPQQTPVGTLPAGAKKEISVPIAGDLSLAGEVVELRVSTLEKRGYDAQPLALEVATEKLHPSQLAIVDVALNDSGGRAVGDGDGRPSNGETLEPVVRIRNGSGTAAVAAVLTVSCKDRAVELLESRVTVPKVPAYGVEEARLLVRLPLGFRAHDLALTFEVADGRGAVAGAATRTESWPVELKQPEIELRSRFYDGTSVGSRGNRDGKVNNGERIELVLTPFNRGNLMARGVRIQITPATAQQGVTVTPRQIDVGDLPASVEGREQRVLVDVARSFGAAEPLDQLPIGLSISQESFPTRQQRLQLPFQLQRPRLDLRVANPPALVQGSLAEVAIEVRNNGDLDAEGVEVAVTSEATGVELLDQGDVPVKALRFKIDKVGPDAAPARLRAKVAVRRGHAESGHLRVSAAQQDFGPADLLVPLEISSLLTKVPPTVPATPVEIKPPPPLPAVPSISFLSHQQGELVRSKVVGIEFEVQHRGELVDVRLHANGVPQRLDAAKELAGGADALRISQYHTQVTLRAGSNELKVVALTAEGARNERVLRLQHEGRTGKIWMVAIGISRYADGNVRQLSYADRDAQEIDAYYRDTMGLPAGQRFLLINEQATLKSIKTLLGTRLPQMATNPDDTVIIFFAGHGQRIRDAASLDRDGFNKYLVAYDSSDAEPYATALPFYEISEIVRRLAAERVVVLIDSCFSGAEALGRSMSRDRRERGPVDEEFLERIVASGEGRIMLTASQAGEPALEQDALRHGVFTYYLLEALKGAAHRHEDGTVDVNELEAYVSEHVPVATHGLQHPKRFDPWGTAGKVVIGRRVIKEK